MLILIPELKSSLESHPPPLDSLEPPPIPRKKATIVFKSEAEGKTEQGNTKPMFQSFNIQSYAAGKSFSFGTTKFRCTGTNSQFKLTKNEWPEKFL